jgi:pristinamycin I synthase-3/4
MTDGYRLSPRQRQLWRLHGPDRSLASPFVVALGGPIDADRLRRALLAVTARHQALRTTFRTVAGRPEPVQIVAGDVSWRVLDPAADTVDDIWREALTEPYAIEDAAPIAATLVRGKDGGHLVVGLSALAADTASIATLVGDLRRAYDGEPAGDVPGYLQFAEWQHDLVESGPDAAYWRQVLEEALPRPRLPLESGATPGGSVRSVLDPSLAGRIRRLAQARRTSAGTVVCTAWAVLVLRLTGAERLTVWRTLGGRDHVDLRAAVGPFARPAPATVTAGPESRFADILLQVEHQTTENERRLDRLTADGDPVAGGSLGFESVAWPPPAGGFALDRTHDGGVASDLSLVHHEGEEMILELRHPPGLPPGGATALLDQLGLVLSAACADPDGGLRSTQVVTPRELAVLSSVNTADDPDVIPLPHMFEEQVAITPHSRATACGDKSLSYAELDRRSNRVAHRLRLRGLGPGSVCALWHEPGAPVLEALLGILKSGAAYLPIDPKWPAERVSAILRDAAPDLLLTQQTLLSEGETLPLPVLCLDRDAEQFATAPETHVDVGIPLDELAYVIYTSGSTGTPKGVCVTHRGLANYLSWCRDAYPLTAGRGSLVHSSLGFDLTVTALFAPLVVGECVRFTTRDGLEGLVHALTEHDDFSVLKITPAHLRLLRRMLPDDRQAKLAHALVIGGEALTEDELAHWRTVAPHLRLFNEYGPTETVVGCCVHDGTASYGRDAVPIGRPIAGTRLHVLDPAMRQVPLGVPGELYIGGAGVARGYHGRPDLTAERFVPDPFATGVASGRLYRSGDLVRCLADGTIEFIGRVDDQEQVNGFRIEPAEIEAALALHSRVHAAAVTVRRELDGAARLLAAVVADSPLDLGELSRFTRDRLPEHLVPAVITSVGALPLTANGKVDRRAVLRLVEPAPASTPPDSSPSTSAGQTVTRIMEEVLGYQGIGLDDNFFDLGGDSFLLLDVAGRLKDEFGIEVTPLTLLEHPTAGAIARLLDGPTATASEDTADTGHARRQREAIAQARSRRAERNES